MDLVKVITQAAEKVISEKLTPMIEQKTESMLESVLDDLFKSYGDIGQKVKDAISSALDIDMSTHNLDDYSGIVAQIIADELNLKTQKGKLKEMIAETVAMSNRGEKVTLQDIADMVIEEVDTEEEYEGDITMHVEEREGHDWKTISIDVEAGLDPKECSIEMCVSNRNGRIFHFRNGSKWSRNDTGPAAMKARLFGLERKLFNLYVTGTTIDLEDEEYSIYWCND